ncbi:MAG: hypothetical protein IKW81_00640 [Pseudobutyrivibrio sp.]|nr:hypothetical protein [Pseudobutyrivibrio sp.]
MAGNAERSFMDIGIINNYNNMYLRYQHVSTSDFNEDILMAVDQSLVDGIPREKAKSIGKVYTEDQMRKMMDDKIKNNPNKIWWEDLILETTPEGKNAKFTIGDDPTVYTYDEFIKEFDRRSKEGYAKYVNTNQDIMNSSNEAIISTTNVASTSALKYSRNGAVQEIDEALISKDRKPIGITTYPVSSAVSHMAIAYMPPESTEEDPIVQVSLKAKDGSNHTYNVHVNDVDPNCATEMEMYAYLTYQGHMGNKIPGAINNYAAYRSLRYSDGSDWLDDYAHAADRFLNEQVNANEIIQRVYSWMKNIIHPDAQKQAGWCRDLLDMLNMENVAAIQEV